MFENIEWLFFDVGQTLVDESIAYEHRIKEIAAMANTTYDNVYKMALSFYKQNKKGDLEAAKALGVELPKWHKEDEVLFKDAHECLRLLSEKYKIGIIANQSLGTKERLKKNGVLQFIDLVIGSAEEGVAKPNLEIFKIALKRGNCNPANAVMIGDRIDNDIVPAKSLGINTIWIKQGFGRYWNFTHEGETPDYVVCNLMDICNVLYR